MVPLHAWSDGPHLPYMEQVSYGPLTCMHGAPHVWYDFSGQFQKSPLHVLNIQTESWHQGDFQIYAYLDTLISICNI